MRVSQLLLLVSLMSAGAACLDVDSDPCDGVTCDDGEACVALAGGPVCACDAYHERVEDECVAIDEGEGEGEGMDE